MKRQKMLKRFAALLLAGALLVLLGVAPLADTSDPAPAVTTGGVADVFFDGLENGAAADISDAVRDAVAKERTGLRVRLGAEASTTAPCVLLDAAALTQISGAIGTEGKALLTLSDIGTEGTLSDAQSAAFVKLGYSPMLVSRLALSDADGAALSLGTGTAAVSLPVPTADADAWLGVYSLPSDGGAPVAVESSKADGFLTFSAPGAGTFAVVTNVDSLNRPTSSDLSEFLKKISIVDSSGTSIYDSSSAPEDGLTLVPGKSYTISLSFAEKDALQFGYDSDGRLVYAIPGVFSIADALCYTESSPVTYPILDGDQNPIGDYRFIKGPDQTWLYAVFDEGYAEQYSNVSMKVDFLASFSGKEDGSAIEFGDGFQITLSRDTDITAAKTASKPYTAPDGSVYVDYTVTVTAVNGAVNSLALSDSMSTKMSIIAAKGVTLTRGSDVYSLPLAEPAVQSSKNVYTFAFPEGFALANGETATLTYTCGWDGGATTGFWNESNTAVFTGTDSAGGTVTGSATTKVTNGSNRVTKSGSLNKTTGLITWTVKINGSLYYAGKAEADRTVTDTLTGAQKYYDPTAAQTVTSGSLPVTVTITREGSSTVLATLSGQTANVTSATAFTYALPALSAADFTGYSAGDNYIYTITYTTMADDKDAYLSYKNSAKIGGSSSSPSVNGGSGAVGVKTAAFADTDGDGAADAIHYTLTAHIPAGNDGKSVYLRDVLTACLYRYDNNRFLWGMNRPENLTVAIAPEAGGDAEASDSYTWRMADSATDDASDISYFNLFFGPAGETGSKPNASSQWPFAQAEVVTVAYDIPINFEIDRDGTRFRFDTDGYATASNALSVIVSGTTVASSTVRVSVNSAGKSGVFDPQTGEYRYTVKLETAQPLTENAAGIQGFPLVFTDRYDANLAYVEGSLRVYVRNRALNTYYAVFALPADKLTNADNQLSFRFTDLAYVSDSSAYGLRYNTGTYAGTGKTFSAWYAASGTNQSLWYSAFNPIQNDSVVEIVYSMKPDASADLFAVTGFTNTADFSWAPAAGETSFGSGSLTSGVTLDYHPLDKTMWSMGSGIAGARILLNSAAADMKSDSDTLQVVDTMNSRMVLRRDTLKIWYRVGESWVEQAYTYSPTGTDIPVTVGSAADGGTTLTLTVADSTAVRLEYEVSLKGSVGESVQVENTVRVSGDKYSSAFHGSFAVSSSTGSGGGSSVQFTLQKVDSLSRTALPGAAFCLYKGDYYANGATLAGLTPVTTVKTIVTGENGTVLLSSDGKTAGLYADLYEDTLYTLAETSAPAGYSAAAPIVFSINSTDAALPDYVEQLVSAGILEVEDAPETVDVAAQKKWADTLSHADDTVTLRLNASYGGGAVPDAYLTGYNVTREVSLGDADGFAHTWSSLPKNYIADGSVSAITYTVSELSGGSAVAQGGRAVIGTRAYTVAYGTENGVLTVTNTLSSELLLKKTSGGGKALSGAVFLLQRQTGENAWSNIGTYTTGADGTVILPALADGNYLLTETAAPRGYNLLAAPVAFTVTNAIVYRGSDSLLDAATGANILTVTDTPIYTLPSTGGRGSAALIAAGTALILSAFVFLCFNRRLLLEK